VLESPSQPPLDPRLHLYLGLGLLIVSGVFLFLRLMDVAPLLGGDRVGEMLGYVLSGVGVVVIGVAVLVFKPKAPERRSVQRVEDYWADPEVVKTVPLIWFLLEGATMIAAIGYLLSANAVPAIVTLAGLTAYWLNGPNVFAKP
jgi:hypothetical protein